MQVCSRRDIEKCQQFIAGFKVSELQVFLQHFRHPKLGRKEELVLRAQQILTNPKYQTDAVQKVLELQTSTTMHQGGHNYQHGNMNRGPRMGFTPGYVVPSTSGGLVGQQHHQQHHQQNGYGYGGQSRALPPYIPAMQQHQVPSVLLANYGHHSSSGPIHSGQVRNVRMVELPFYDQKKVLLPLSELPAFSGIPKLGEARIMQQFTVPTELHPELNYRSEEKPLPRYEIQLRVFQLDINSVQSDAFPPNCVVKLEEYNVSLPNIIPTNKPNAEQKRLSRPVNLTPYCMPLRKERPYKITFEWSGDKRAWAFGVFLVVHLNSTILQDRLLKNVNAKRSFDDTKTMIIQKLSPKAEDDVVMDTLKTSLVCPLLKTKIKIPARGRDCTHLQTFDLTNYLMMTEKRPEWKCPVCSGNTIFSKLIVDEYFQMLVNDVGTGVDEVELLKNGRWRKIQLGDIVDLQDDDEDEVVVAKSSSAKMTKSTPQRSSLSSTPTESAPSRSGGPAAVDDDIIILSDSDESEEGEAEANRRGTANSVPRQEPQQTSSRSPVNSRRRSTSRMSTSGASTPSSVTSSSSTSDSATVRRSKGRSPTRIPLVVSTQMDANTPAAGPHSSSGESDESVIVLDEESSGGGGSETRQTTPKSAPSGPKVSSAGTSVGNVSRVRVSEGRSGETTRAAAAIGTGPPTPLQQQPRAPSSTTTQTSSTTSHHSSPLNANGMGPIDMAKLHTNGFHPPLFHPVIEEAAKTQVAQSLATFLQHIYAKNSQKNGLSNGMH